MSITFAAGDGTVVCPDDGPTWSTVDWDHGLNLANSNARELLQSLGYTFDFDGTIDPDDCNSVDPYGGTLDPDDVIARCLMLQGLYDDPGMPTYTDEQAGRVSMVMCGRPAGYLNDRAKQLAELAEQAKSRGALVHYG